MKFARILGHAAALGVLGLSINALFVQRADARASGPVLGLGSANDMACQAINSGTLQNTCGRTVSIDFPLIVDTAGTKNVIVSAFGQTSANTVGCRSDGMDKAALTHSFSNGGAYMFLTTFGIRTDIPTLSSVVPAMGQLVLNCQMNNGGLITKIDWTS